MKLSICIPVYNFDVRELVETLRSQINQDRLDAEILVIDDSSESHFKELLRQVSGDIDELLFLNKNVGRSKIRNQFLEFAKGEYFLFLDCDAKVDHSGFLKTYFEAFDSSPEIQVFYGNFKVDSRYQSTLRNLYSEQREIFKEGKIPSYNFFKTVNFAVKKSCFQNINFEETLSNYGYEDYIFAKQLEKASVPLQILDNPVIHQDNTENIIFIEKVKEGIRSLVCLLNHPETQEFAVQIKAYRYAERIRKLGLQRISRMFYNAFEARLIQNLMSEKPNLQNLDFIKLGTLLDLLKQLKNKQ